jgi:hypothetical protein
VGVDRQTMPEIGGVNMKYDGYEYWLATLEKDQARLKELEEKGLEAISTYDITIAYMGNAEMALEQAKQLKRNHITYDKDRLAEYEAIGIQEKLSLF